MIDKTPTDNQSLEREVEESELTLREFQEFLEGWGSYGDSPTAISYYQHYLKKYRKEGNGESAWRAFRILRIMSPIWTNLYVDPTEYQEVMNAGKRNQHFMAP